MCMSSDEVYSEKQNLKVQRKMSANKRISQKICKIAFKTLKL